MFERYTEKARRVIFFARYEASQFGTPAIEPEHLLLGLLKEDKALNRSLIVCTQMTKMRLLTVRGGWDDISDFNFVVTDDDPVN